MPLLRIDGYAGRTDAEVTALLDAIHRAVVDSFGVPERDRYQIYQEHPASAMIVQDTGLGIERGTATVVITMTSRHRPDAQKRDFYARLADYLKPCGVAPGDIVTSIVTNTDADWSFGNGQAQYLTGDLR